MSVFEKGGGSFCLSCLIMLSYSLTNPIKQPMMINILGILA